MTKIPFIYVVGALFGLLFLLNPSYQVALQETVSQTPNCNYTGPIDCSSTINCTDSSVIMLQNIVYYCGTPLNITGSTVIFIGGLSNSSLNITADYVQLHETLITQNLFINYTQQVNITGDIQVSGNTFILPRYQNLTNTSIYFESNSSFSGKKILAEANNIILYETQITTSPNICLYMVVNVASFSSLKKQGISQIISEVLKMPVNIIFFAQNYISMSYSTINTTIIGIFAQNSTFINNIINTTAASCYTNLGKGKGLQVQMPNKVYCSLGGSSAGYGVLSNSSCQIVMQYFMFLSHSFPYISKGPYLATGSGGYGYKENIGNQGAGGGIIVVFSQYQIQSYYSQFLASGGQIAGNNSYVSAGSGGSVFVFTNKLFGNNTNFSAAGGASLNNNGSGAGGIVKISYDQSYFNQTDLMWVNVSQGYQSNTNISQNLTLSSNGIFYGTFCPPGQYPLYLVCQLCPNGQYSLLGDTLCQVCPPITGFSQNKTINGIFNITNCFSEKEESIIQKLVEPNEIAWHSIFAYIIALIVTVIIGTLIKKYYRKKLSVMETQSFSLDDAKKDVQQTRILTQRLKAQRNIKFQDLMYHIHRITLFGSNNPQCPWALPETPPEQIKKYILRQGFIDFSEKFNKVAKWTQFQTFIANISVIFYIWHWFYYDKIKKSKFKKLLQLLEQSKQFNLINNYDFEDKNMVTIKISKNTDYTICYLDFMVYDRADTKYFTLNSPFIISVSGQGNFLRPFYLQDRDVFFNSLFYIINKAKQKNEEQFQDQKKELFINLYTQKKKQENRNKLIDFFKKFNNLSITLDLSAPLSTFVETLISLIEYIAEWNQNYFKQLNIQLDLILMISKVKKGHILSNQIHILSNKNPQVFKEFMQENIPKMNRYQKYDLKLGLFVYNPDQEVVQIKHRKTTQFSRQTKNYIKEPGAGSDEQKIQQPLVQLDQDQPVTTNKKKFKLIQHIVRFFNLGRYFVMTHRKLYFDKDLTKFFVTIIILFQCLLVCVWSVKIQIPYPFFNLVSPFVGIMWMVSGSYGIGKLFLIFNQMALIDAVVCLIVLLIFQSTPVIIVCQIVTIIFILIVIPLATKYLSVCRKLSTSKMFK